MKFLAESSPERKLNFQLLLLSTILMAFTLDLNPWFAGGAALAISMAVIGVHGILSGTSTADFAGAKNAGAATGIVDGFFGASCAPTADKLRQPGCDTKMPR